MAIGGSVLMAAVVFGNDLYNYMKPRRLGIYGPTMVGKTTLDMFMTTPGEMADVEDRTTSLVVSKFLTNLVEGEDSPPSALAKATSDLRNDSRHTHPYYWAPFVLMGRYE